MTTTTILNEDTVPPNIDSEDAILETGEYKGYKYAVTKSPLTGDANPNGYVRLPEVHPWLSADDIEYIADVHGGLTYGPGMSPSHNHGNTRRWVGFDTIHACDHIVYSDGSINPGDEYWDADKVRAECEHLIDQAITAAR